MTKSLLVLAAVVSAAMLNGCSTAKGFGQDLEDLGRLIQGQEPKARADVNTNVARSISNVTSTMSASRVNQSMPNESTARISTDVSSYDVGAGSTYSSASSGYSSSSYTSVDSGMQSDDVSYADEALEKTVQADGAMVTVYPAGDSTRADAHPIDEANSSRQVSRLNSMLDDGVKTNTTN